MVYSEYFQEFSEGFEACRARKLRAANPYHVDLLQQAWDAGWTIASAAIESGWGFGR